MSEDDTRPRFRVEGKDTPFPCVYIQCSKCHVDIRPMLKQEIIAVNRGYYCKKCDDGAIHLNMPIKDKGDGGNYNV